MARILLDSSVVIDLLRGRPGAIRRLRAVKAAGDDPYVCAVTVEEITRGLRPEEDDAFLEILEGLIPAPLGIPEGRLAGFWKRTLAKRGRTISQADAVIVIEHWPAGE